MLVSKLFLQYVGINRDVGPDFKVSSAIHTNHTITEIVWKSV